MRKVIVGVFAVALVAVGVVLYTSRDKDEYVVYAQFSDAGGILKNFNVKIGQVAAGKITKITLDKDDNAVVKMVLDKGAYPIGSGATAKVRPVNLLGEKYVDLSPGDLTQPVKSGSMIPKSKTGVPIELDDALNTLDPDTRGAMRIIINEAGLSMAGRGADFNKTLEDLPPALDAAKDVVTEADQENQRLGLLVDQGDRVLASVNSKRDDLGDLVGSAGDALKTAAQRRAQLGRTIQTAPAALTQLRTTLGTLQGAAVQLQPAADDIVGTAPSLRDTLSRIPDFADDAESTLDEARKVAPQLEKLGRRSTPTLKVLRPTVQRLDRFSGDISPLVNSLDQGGATNALLSFINGWAGVTDTQDKLGHVFRLRLTVDSNSIMTALDRLGSQPTKRKNARAKKSGDDPLASTPDTPAPTGPSGDGAKGPLPGLPALPKVPDLPIPKVQLPDAQQVVKDATGAVTGLLGGSKDAQPQSSDGGDAGKLLNYLLGS